ncbi:hypothetical protein EDD17DRAFT_1592619 [Pisolithus thermaeus]|nr:hypothetical protein EDD17DRAFT_1592619 [Pisolithus thermaeus]
MQAAVGILPSACVRLIRLARGGTPVDAPGQRKNFVIGGPRISFKDRGFCDPDTQAPLHILPSSAHRPSLSRRRSSCQLTSTRMRQHCPSILWFLRFGGVGQVHNTYGHIDIGLWSSPRCIHRMQPPNNIRSWT